MQGAPTGLRFRWVRRTRPSPATLVRQKRPPADPPRPRRPPRHPRAPSAAPLPEPLSLGSRCRPGTGTRRRRRREPRPSACRPARTAPRPPYAGDPSPLAQRVGVRCQSSRLPSTAQPRAQRRRDAPDHRCKTTPAPHTTPMRPPGGTAAPPAAPRRGPGGVQWPRYDSAVVGSVPMRSPDAVPDVHTPTHASSGGLRTPDAERPGLVTATGVPPHGRAGAGSRPPYASCWHRPNRRRGTCTASQLAQGL